jgi:cytoskeletal protein CcmA (bactofilin family)
MFGKSKKVGSEKVDSLIGRKSSLEGNLSFSGGLHIDGSVKGKITAAGDDRSTLSLSQHGTVEGDVRVPYIRLNGTVTGNVYASERVVLAANARVTGDVHYNLLEMALGAQVNGRLIRIGDEARVPHGRSVRHPLRYEAPRPGGTSPAAGPAAKGAALDERG